jgi:site-specific recombinase XerD
MPDQQPTPIQLALFPATAPPPLATPPSPPRLPPSLGQAIAAYCDHLAAAGRAAHTVRSTAFDLAALLAQLGNRPLAEVQPAHLAAHLRWLRDAKRNRPASLRRKIATLKGFFRHAVAAGWLATDPTADLTYPAPPPPRLVALTPDEAEAVVAASLADPVWHALVLLLLDTGLKRDELLALRPADLYLAPDPAQSRITVRHTQQAKRLRRRTLPLTPRCHAALARMLTIPWPSPTLFRLSVRGVNFVVETVGKRAGLQRIRRLTPEILRDTFAVRAMQQRVAVEQARARAGATPAELDALRTQHDREVAALLGISRYSEMPARYRAAALALLAPSG